MQHQDQIIVPPYLTAGSTVGITCPCSYVSEERVSHAITVLQQWGYTVKPGKTIGMRDIYFSGTDAERLADLQAMLDDPAIDAIVMGRGGYGMSRIIDQLDFSNFVRKPKWITGFSDITVLHNHIFNNYGIATLHSPMCGAFKPETEQEAHLLSFKNALAGAPLEYVIPHAAHNRNGRAEAVLTGGNLSLLVHLEGSASEVNTDGKILFLEDIGEHLYKIDRMMLTLKRAGKLSNLKGIIFGGFTDMEDTDKPFGQTVEEILWDKVKEYDYPVCFNFPCGHQDINYTLTLGDTHILEVTETGSRLALMK